jgi:hypothetical protein
MFPGKEGSGWVFGLLALLAVGIFGYFWYSDVYRPAIAAVRMLTDLAASLRKAGSAWAQTSEVSMRGLYSPLSLFTGNVVILIHGTWEGDQSTIQFKLAFGNPDSSSSDEGIYHPPMTSLCLISRRVLAGKAGIDRYSKSQIACNSVFTSLGMSPRLRRVSDELFAYGEDGEIARLFAPPVLALVRTFPRELFGPPLEGVAIDGSDVRIMWEQHEADPKVIEAAFRLLKTISDAGAAGR